MAYKFQNEVAIMSGALDQEGNITVFDQAGSANVALGDDGEISGSSDLKMGGTVQFDGVTDTALAVASDSFYFRDSDGLMRRDTMADYATAIAGDGLAASSGVLAVGVDDSTIELNSDALRLKDDGVTGAKLAPAVAGAGLAQDGSGNLDIGAATNGGIAVNANDIGMDISDLAAASIASGDTFAFDDSGTTKKETVDDLATLFAGDGLAASSAVLSVQVSGALKVASDKVGISGSFAGNGLGFSGGEDSISSLAVNVDDSSIEINSDSLRVKAGGVTDAMLNDDVASGLAGDGLTASSGVMAVGAGALIDVQANVVDVDLTEATEAAIASGDYLIFLDGGATGTHAKEAIDDIATLFAGNGLSAASAVMAVDLNELSAAAVDVANDSFAIIDANDSNGSRKESIADLVAAMAGTGLTATAGVLSVAAASGVNAVGDADATLTESFNYASATISDNRTWTLPASSGLQVGDVIHVKLAAVDPGKKVTIARDGTQTIDGLTSIVLESPNAAVSLKYVAANLFKIF